MIDFCTALKKPDFDDLFNEYLKKLNKIISVAVMIMVLFNRGFSNRLIRE